MTLRKHGAPSSPETDGRPAPRGDVPEAASPPTAARTSERRAGTSVPGAIAETHDEPDGRRRRGNTSRARIVDALSRLVREGNLTPGAARVAELAGVSLRTVFRHFDEMDSLFKEIAENIQAQVLPAFFRPYLSETWKERLVELVERRIELYEAILPFKLSGDLKRFQSDYLSKDYHQHLKLEKMSLESVLPVEITSDPPLVHALMAAAGFQGWRILRKDQELELADARAVVMRTVDALVASFEQQAAASRKKA